MNNGLSWKKWRPGDPHLMNRIQWGKEEYDEIMRVLETDWFGYSNPNKNLEEEISKFTGVPNILLTNSGSAAIEVGLLSLKHEGAWKPGDLVLHPVTTFATSISSAINLGLTPVYLETKPYTYVVDPEQVSMAIDRYPETRGMILPYLLGSVPDVDKILKILGKRRFLLEDCCDTLGSKFNEKHVGSFGDFAAYSFYASHHISTAGVGGAIGTCDKKLAEIAKSIIFWGRDFKPGDDEFLKRYTYKTLGIDGQMSAIQAAFGLAQVRKVKGFIESRSKQFYEMTKLFSEYDFFHLPVSHPSSLPSWFSYPLTIKESAPFDRSEFAKYLTKSKVEIRPLMCGNITKQTPFCRSNWISLNDGRFPIGDEIENRSLFIPCWGMSEEQKSDYYTILKSFLDKFV